MGHRELLAEAVDLAVESVEKDWGGPFGAVIVRGGEIVARGQNRVLLTGDPTAHAEMEAIRKAVQVLNPRAPTIPEEHRDTSTLAYVPRPEGSPDPLPERARMLQGCSIYTSGIPCPMCMSALYWARIEAVYYSCGPEAAKEIGFDDAFQYEDFRRPYEEREIRLEQLHPEMGAEAYRAWEEKPDRYPY